MSDYARQYDFNSKTGTVIYGSEVDAEFDAVLTAVASKVDESREASASGIATLDGSALVPVAQLPSATETAEGIIEKATTAEAVTGTDTDRAVTPAGVDAVLENAAGMLGDIKDLTDPGADRILFWDDVGAAGVTGLAVGTNLDITGTTLSAPTATLEAALSIANLSDYDANDNIDHTTVTLTAGSGLSGGGTIAANRSFAVDLTGLTQADATDIGGADEFLMNDGGTNKAVRWQDFGIPQTDDTSTSPLSAADLTYANRWFNCNNASAISAVIPANASVAYPVGTCLAFHQRGAGQVTVSVTTDTLRSPNGAKTAVQYSTIFATKIGTTEWVITGDSTS